MNARNEMKERHELEEFLKTKKTDTVSLLEDEKTCPLSPNEDHDKNMGVDAVTSDDQAGAIDLTNDNVRISQEDKRKSYVGGFATDRARLKLEVEGVRGRRHTLQPSHGLTHQQRMQLKLEEGSTKSYSNKSEPSVRSSSSSTVQSSIPDKSRMRSHRNSLQPSHELTYQQRMKLKMDEQSSAGSSSSVSSSTTESSTADKSRMRSHRNSLEPSHELTYQQRMKLKMDEQSSARSSSSVSSSTTEPSTADKGRMKSEGGGVRGRRHSSLPSHELTFEQRLKIKMDEGGTKSYNNKSESNVRSSHRERIASNGKKTENRIPDRKATVDDTEPLSSSSSPQKYRRNSVAVSKSMVDAKRRSGTDRDRRSSSVIGQ
jgi:Spy/CpxP family protein refolding chaperone